MRAMKAMTLLLVIGGVLAMTGCSAEDKEASDTGGTEAEVTQGGLGDMPASPPTLRLSTSSGIWQPGPDTTWQWQLHGPINTSWEVDMYDIDLFDTPESVISQLKANRRVVICYFSAGTHEDWRPDAAQFSADMIGKPLAGWPGEHWLDIRQIDALAPIMSARLDLAVSKGCDGVEPDNVDGYANETGFPLSAANQIAYNRWLAAEAHARGLSVGLKNTLDLIPDLIGDFDWALNEECFQYDECNALLPFIEANKAVFGVEYEGDPENYCPQAVAMRFSWLTKTYDLDDEPPGACE